ncbi:MAG: hypothetical protein RLZZ241_684 [Bacteroidota bacterium]|jgi:KDO2-lipid IV(A) lauroyltransferase
MYRLKFLSAYPFIWVISRTPFPLLYLFSDFLFFVLYYLVRYRRKVVRSNLRLVFPTKHRNEIKTLEHKFYRHFCDIFLETVKTLSISEAELKARFTFQNIEVLRAYENANESVIILFPHYANWEWATALNLHLKGKGYGIYQPLVNPYFDKMVRYIRARFGGTLITTKETREVVAKNRAEKIHAIYGILTDQSPRPTQAYHWSSFMGITVPMHTGAEYMSKTLNLPVLYLKVTKIKRGYYTSEFSVLAHNPNDFKNYAITDAFFRATEQSILEQPEFYLWSHRRWKHRDKDRENFTKPQPIKN